MEAIAGQLYLDVDVLDRVRSGVKKIKRPKLFGTDGCWFNSDGSFFDVRDYVRRIGERYGVVPFTKKVKQYVEPEDIGKEPEYENHAGYSIEPIRSLYKRVKARINRYFAEKQGVVPYIGRNIKRIIVKKLPTWWHRYLGRPVGKIYGYFDAKTKTMVLDPVNFPEMCDREKDDLRRGGLPVNAAERVMAEEMWHSVQDIGGTLYRYSRADVEGEANLRSDYLFWNMGSYPIEKMSYEMRYGNRDITDLRKKVPLKLSLN